jgi:lipopolysaccharide biosynthesis glycosyltransferase
MINLCYCVNNGVLHGIMMSLVSASEVTSEPLNVIVLTGDFTSINPAFKPFGEKERAYLEKILQSKNPANTIKVLDVAPYFFASLKDSPNLKSSYTPYTLLRLFMDKIPSLPDKILYLDADTIVMKDLARLYAVDVTGKELAWVRDAYGRFFIGPNYCNAGVLLLNLPELKKNQVFEKCLERLNKKHYPFPDQDVLNKFTRGHKLYLPREFNEQTHLRPTTVIRHYCNQPRIFPNIHALIAKPWDIERIHKVYKITAHDRLYEECQHYWKEFEHE